MAFQATQQYASQHLANVSVQLEGFAQKAAAHRKKFLLGISQLRQFANHYLIAHGGGFLVIPEKEVPEFKRLLVKYYDDEDIIISQIFMRPAFWWITVSILGLFGIWLIYNGVLLAFNLKAPRWRPGTIIFILWIVSLLVMTVWIIRRMLIIGTLL